MQIATTCVALLQDPHKLATLFTGNWYGVLSAWSFEPRSEISKSFGRVTKSAKISLAERKWVFPANNDFAIVTGRKSLEPPRGRPFGGGGVYRKSR
ncbi:MAG: hypothetical protein WC342_03870, partial [Methanoregula sp.]